MKHHFFKKLYSYIIVFFLCATFNSGDSSRKKCLPLRVTKFKAIPFQSPVKTKLTRSSFQLIYLEGLEKVGLCADGSMYNFPDLILHGGNQSSSSDQVEKSL